MVGDEVEQHADAPARRVRDEPVEVLDGPELGVNRPVVRDVAAPVTVGRWRDRVQPDAVDAEPREMVEPVEDPRQVADAVVVRVGEGPGVDRG